MTSFHCHPSDVSYCINLKLQLENKPQRVKKRRRYLKSIGKQLSGVKKAPPIRLPSYSFLEAPYGAIIDCDHCVQSRHIDFLNVFRYDFFQDDDQQQHLEETHKRRVETHDLPPNSRAQ
jgi:hypothetical protein